MFAFLVVSLSPHFLTVAVVCHGIADQMKLRISGKKSMLGTIAGGRNNRWINGTHPALLYDLRCNSDTLLTYRLPIIPESHSTRCSKKDCVTEERMGEVRMLIAALRCQRDQAGYISDYVSKRQPIARDEIKAFMQGQHQLCTQLNVKNASTVRHAKRSAQRIMSDLYGRGTLRMAVEAVNLLTMRKKHDEKA